MVHADTAPPLPQISCYCTDTGGERVELGQSACLQVGQRMFTARCEMSLNVPIWREKSEGCAVSSLPSRTEAVSSPQG
ncbi:hypothetical protein N9C89_08620 [Halocynthiibacter sp. SDUM655004]|uniref:Uncharacterized protein n=2 Tax=Paracoccaceae TaxID=31989 RepID=A0AAE3IZ15_9RHOB|nr:hypothetical protein [Halocynthiibacter sp. C4]MCV6824619.1 hypothetical protein [Halocynthiibacter halioticoli]MCW4057620.1 hypothetical protein [Halocynthiibacter sp. SDUM655004]MDE0589347.1 hypothetical protein [Halocynthiibacter sp. C4]